MINMLRMAPLTDHFYLNWLNPITPGPIKWLSMRTRRWATSQPLQKSLSPCEVHCGVRRSAWAASALMERLVEIQVNVRTAHLSSRQDSTFHDISSGILYIHGKFHVASWGENILECEQNILSAGIWYMFHSVLRNVSLCDRWSVVLSVGEL